MRVKASPCGRFVVVDDVHLDRALFEAVDRWASRRGLRLQDAMQLALCALGDEIGVAAKSAPASCSRIVAAPVDLTE